MVKSILEQLAEGEFSLKPRFFKPNSQYAHAIGALSECEAQLLVALSKDELKLLQQFTDAQAEVCRLTGIDQFIYGYRLGMLITTEVFMGKSAALENEDGTV